MTDGEDRFGDNICPLLRIDPIQGMPSSSALGCKESVLDF